MIEIVRETNEEFFEQRRVEYQALRAEILYSDQACMIITGALLGGSITVLTMALKDSPPSIAALLSPVWLIGYLYISEKRFVIETIAMYMREALENEQPGFGWERWLRHRRQGRQKFRRFFPYHLETIISSIATLAIPAFIYWRSQWGLCDAGLIISALLVPLMIAFVCINLQAYSRSKLN